MAGRPAEVRGGAPVTQEEAWAEAAAERGVQGEEERNPHQVRRRRRVHLSL